MQPIEALGLLGSKRVIWIDDQLAKNTAEQLARALADHLDISRQLGLEDFDEVFDKLDGETPGAQDELIERLKDCDDARRTEISQLFHTKFIEGKEGTADLNAEQIATVRAQLEIKEADAWAFDGAEQRMKSLCTDGDEDITYVIDLQDEYGAPGNERGLDLLRALALAGSKATTFLLTHSATKKTEAHVEDTLRAKLKQEDKPDSEGPVCVIAKERIEGDKSVIADGLRVAIKRAGLRRGVHEILLRASTQVQSAFNEARSSLLRVPPEELDHYVVDRAYKEGVSELHVVERALAASMSEKIKMLFAVDAAAIKGATRLRDLREIVLPAPGAPSTDLEAFRRMELWESDELVNKSYALLACGDVFVVEGDGAGDKAGTRFLLLAQPCDVSLRPSGKRDSDMGTLVKITPRAANEEGAGSAKKPLLPFKLEGQEWVCDFRRSAPVNLAILDLATLRSDGIVSYAHKDAETLPAALLPGQKKNAKRLSKVLDTAILERAAMAEAAVIRFQHSCHLTISSNPVFGTITMPTFAPRTIEAKGRMPAIPSGSFSWNLRRIGRIRMPYAAALLSNYLSVQGREAFDLDYLKTDATPCAPCAVDTA